MIREVHDGDNMNLPRRTIWRRCLALLLAAVVLVSWPPASAHEIRPAIATLALLENGQVALDITLNLEAAIAGIGSEHEDTSDSPAAKQYDALRALPPDALRGAFDRFAPEFLTRISLGHGGSAVPLRVSGASIPEVGDTALPRISRVSLGGTVPRGVEKLHWRADPKLGHSVIRVRDAASEQIVTAEYVTAGKTSAPISVRAPEPQGAVDVFLGYLEVGFTHIVPKGLDHILFVIGLFLLSTRLGPLLWQVTAFTIAHTATLALSMAGIVELSPAVVEPLIAASIIYVAVENIFTDRLHRWRPVIVFCFGLLHGLGFAGILQEIGPAPGQFLLSLVAFNIGVELGQLAVIAGCFLAVGWTMRRTWHRRAVVIPASIAIAIVAGFWVIERT
jgi:hypothetical protein